MVLDQPSDFPLRVTSLAPLLGGLSCPLLGLFGADDQYPSPEQTEIFRGLLTQGNTQCDLHTYEGAGHTFIAVDRPSYRPEVATEAWREIWNFLDKNLS